MSSTNTVAENANAPAEAETKISSEMPAEAGNGPYDGVMVTHDRRIVPVKYREIAGLAVIGGDMIIGTHEDMQMRAATLKFLKSGQLEDSPLDSNQRKSFSLLSTLARQQGSAALAPQHASALARILGWPTLDPVWPSRTIPYEIDTSIPASGDDPRRENIRRAADMWNSQSVVKLRPASEVQVGASTAVLVFVDHPTADKNFACMSSVGYHPSGFRQRLYINPSCKDGNIAHEIGHALGLHHEHQRPDRTTFLAIDAKVPQDTDNFGPVDGRRLTAHDLCSIMHYAADTTTPDWFQLTAAGGATHDSCAASFPNERDCRDVGQRCRPSAGDIETIKKLYPVG